MSDETEDWNFYDEKGNSIGVRGTIGPSCCRGLLEHGKIYYMSISDQQEFQRYSAEPVFYMAHPIASDNLYSFDYNMEHVVEMMKFFYDIGVRVVAPYHTIITALEDRDPKYQRIGLETDLVVVRALRRLILVGHKISSGMTDELHAATEANSVVWNFVGLSRADIRKSAEIRAHEIARIARETDVKLGREPQYYGGGAIAIGHRAGSIR